MEHPALRLEKINKLYREMIDDPHADREDLRLALRIALSIGTELAEDLEAITKAVSEETMMRSDVLKKSEDYRVVPLFSRQKAHFDVTDKDGVTHNIMIQVFADTTYAGIKGTPSGEIDSYALAAIKWIARYGRIRPTHYEPGQITQARRNECLQLVRESNRRINEVLVGEHESTLHARMKMLICKDLVDQGKQFVCEAIFKDGGGRADILVLDDFEVIEIAVSESDESIDRKAMVYPEGLRIRVIRVKKGEWKDGS